VPSVTAKGHTVNLRDNQSDGPAAAVRYRREERPASNFVTAKGLTERSLKSFICSASPTLWNSAAVKYF